MMKPDQLSRENRVRWHPLPVAGASGILVLLTVLACLAAEPGWPRGSVARYRSGGIDAAELLRGIEWELAGAPALDASASLSLDGLLSELPPGEAEELIQNCIARRLLFESDEGQQLALHPGLAFEVHMDRIHALARTARATIAGSIPPATDGAIRDYIAAHREEFEIPEIFLARQLFINIDFLEPPARRRTPAEALALITDLHARVMDGEDFAELVREYSDSQSRRRDGLVGPFESGEVLDIIERTCRDLEVGEISRPLAIEEGYNLIQLVDHQAARLPPEDQVQAEISRRLYLERVSQRMAGIRRAMEEGTQVPLTSEALVLDCSAENVLFHVGRWRVTSRDVCNWLQTLGNGQRRHYLLPDGAPDQAAVADYLQAYYESALLANWALLHDRESASIVAGHAQAGLYFTVTDYLMESQVDHHLNVLAASEPRLLDYYHTNLDRWREPPLLQVEEVVVEVDAGDHRDARHLYKARNQARRSAARLAASLAEGLPLDALRGDPSRPLIVETTWVPLPDLREEVRRSVLASAFTRSASPAALVEGPLASGNGFRVIRVLASRPGSIPPYETIRDAVADAWKMDHYSEATEQVLHRILMEGRFEPAPRLARFLERQRAASPEDH